MHLKQFLSSQLPETRDVVIRNLERLPGGASRETWSFDAEWQERGEEIARSCILRRDPVASLLEAGLTTDRSFEFRTVKALEGLPIPVPRMYWLDAEGKWLGRPSLIMERMPGQPTPPTFPADGDPVLRAKLASQFVEILAQVHRADWENLGLSFLGVPGEGKEAALRQITLWEEVYEKDRLEAYPLLSAAFAWLKEHAPETDRVTLVHGDFRSGNYLYDDSGTITAMLDWELAHLGDPMEDLGWACMRFWSGRGLVVGLMGREEFFQRYEELSGMAVNKERVFFYEVLGNVKMAVIAVSGVRTFCEGKSTDVVMALVGFLLPRLFEDLAAQIRL